MRFESYSGLHASTAAPVHPATLDALALAVSDATRQGRRVTIRGGGLSFDAHALGDDLMVSVDWLDTITVDTKAGTATVGAGARWRDVLLATASLGFVPPVVVTSGEATVGGTLSANCHSRFSPTLGKEGCHVVSFKLVTAHGTVHRCSRLEDPELFYGVIGGFGLLGVVAEVTFRLTFVGKDPRVETTVTRHTDLTELPRLTRPAMGNGPGPALFGVLALKHGTPRLLLSEARLVAGRALAPMVPHQPTSPIRVPVDWLVHAVPAFGEAFWNFAFDHYVRQHPPYVDDLAGYTFLMDGHTRAKRAAQRFGVPFRSVQASYVIPAEDDASAAPSRLMEFIGIGLSMLRTAGHRLALADVLWLPCDEPFALSSTRGGGGYVVTFTLADVRPRESAALEASFVSLTDECIARGGRTNLIKSVYATPAQAGQMYGAMATELFRVKARVDPSNTFGNALMDRLFPEIARA